MGPDLSHVWKTSQTLRDRGSLVANSSAQEWFATTSSGQVDFLTLSESTAGAGAGCRAAL